MSGYRFEHADEPVSFAGRDAVSFRLVCERCPEQWVWSLDRSILDNLPRLPEQIVGNLVDRHNTYIHGG